MFYIDVSETQTGNQEWTIKRHWQYWAHKTQDEDKQSKKYLKTKPKIFTIKTKTSKRVSSYCFLLETRRVTRNCVLVSDLQVDDSRNRNFLKVKTGVNSGVVPAPLVTPVFSGVCDAPFLVFCVVFCRSLFVLFLLATVLSAILRFASSDYPFGIF